MIKLYDAATGEVLGTITEAQLQFLNEHLEEESLEDRDYYLNTVTLDMLAVEGADESLLGVMRSGMGNRGEFEFRWSRG